MNILNAENVENMETKSCFIAVVGRPNVGKSSLLNAFLGEKVAIVSPKPQTTRTRITGILTQGDTQMVFIDTPGLHKPKTKLSEYMVDQVRQSVADVDAAILVTEPTGDIARAEYDLMDSFKAGKVPVILAVNKVDLLRSREEVLPRIQAFSEYFSFEEVVPVSALTGHNVNLLLEKAGSYAQPGPFFFDSDSLTDQPERVICAEIIREKLLYFMRDEVPHGVAVGIEEMKERPEKALYDIQAVIYCERDSHKGMIIGKQGAMLKKIGSRAREDMERFLDTKVNLQCWVKVKEDWRNREGLMRSFGYQ